MSIDAKNDRDEKLAKIALPVVDCECMDSKTRSVLVYLIKKELRYLSTFPRAWVEGQQIDLTDLKASIENCKLQKLPKGRKLSEYQEFIKVCATSKKNGGGGKTFKECIQDWNASQDWRESKEQAAEQEEPAIVEEEAEDEYGEQAGEE
jgi:hypothetical protein